MPEIGKITKMNFPHDLRHLLKLASVDHVISLKEAVVGYRAQVVFKPSKAVCACYAALFIEQL